MLNDFPSQRSTTNDDTAPVKISSVDVIDRTGPRSALGRSASAAHKNVPSKADTRGSIPLAFSIGDKRVNAVAATKIRNIELAKRAETPSHPSGPSSGTIR